LTFAASVGWSRSALAAPAPQAISDIGFAIDACDSVLNGGSDAADGWARYSKGRAQALKEDPTIRSWMGLVRGRWRVVEWLAKCDAELPKRVEQGRSTATLQQALSAAKEFACAPDVRFGDLARCRDEKAKIVAMAGSVDRVRAFDARAWDTLERQEAELVQAIARRDQEQRQMNAAAARAQAKYEADMQREEAQRKAAQAKYQAKVAAFGKLLKGDRLRIFKRFGDLPGVQTRTDDIRELARAELWIYADTDTATVNNRSGFPVATVDSVCTHYFTFRKDKLTRTERVGSGCGR
jgi:hypothetical protein